MAAGIQPEKLKVDCVRDPGERMPVGGLMRRQRPAYCFKAETGLDMRVFRDVAGVIGVEEGKMIYRAIQKDCSDRQHQAEQKRFVGRLDTKKLPYSRFGRTGFCLNHFLS